MSVLYNLGRGYETVGRDTAEAKLDQLTPGQLLRFKAIVDKQSGTASHLFVAIATNEDGLHTGRRRYMIGCTTCDKLMHESTTGPLERVDQHLQACGDIA